MRTHARTHTRTRTHRHQSSGLCPRTSSSGRPRIRRRRRRRIPRMSWDPRGDDDVWTSTTQHVCVEPKQTREHMHPQTKNAILKTLINIKQPLQTGPPPKCISINCTRRIVCVCWASLYPSSWVLSAAVAVLAVLVMATAAAAVAYAACKSDRTHACTCDKFKL